jgi:hypothetical protein
MTPITGATGLVTVQGLAADDPSIHLHRATSFVCNILGDFSPCNSLLFSHYLRRTAIYVATVQERRTCDETIEREAPAQPHRGNGLRAAAQK